MNTDTADRLGSPLNPLLACHRLPVETPVADGVGASFPPDDVENFIRAANPRIYQVKLWDFSEKFKNR
jgi:hypothetical protein